jgi:hypothetical protein
LGCAEGVAVPCSVTDVGVIQIRFAPVCSSARFSSTRPLAFALLPGYGGGAPRRPQDGYTPEHALADPQGNPLWQIHPRPTPLLAPMYRQDTLQSDRQTRQSVHRRAYPASNSFKALSMNPTSSGFKPPPAKCPQTPGMTRNSAFGMRFTAYSSSSGGK